MGLHFARLLDRLLEHSIGLEAEEDDHLLRDVQLWLLESKLLQRTPSQAPCDLPTCKCWEQLNVDTQEKMPVVCYRLANAEIRTDSPKAMRGTIKFYNPRKEFGFVIPDGGGKDIFLHKRSVGHLAPDLLKDGTPVLFTAEECSYGLRVVSIRPE